MQQTRSPYQIAMLQMDCDLFHVSNNLDKAEKQIREAAAHGAKLICLPEVFNVGYLGTCIPDMMKLAEIEDGPSLTRMRSLAKELSVFILAPILFSTPSGVENSAFLIDDIGTIHCDFDNGRSLGVVPGEDSFRMLTDEELAEEQNADMDEDESGPVMGM